MMVTSRACSSAPLHQRHFERRGRVLWLLCLVLLVCLAVLWSLTACLPQCQSDADCQGNLSCGPGRVCVAACFVGQTTGCQPGFVCAADGVSCVPQTSENSTADGGSEAVSGDAGTEAPGSEVSPAG